MPATQRKIEVNLHRIRTNIAVACGKRNRFPEAVRIVGVTKSVDEQTIRNLVDAGVTDLAENRVQELAARAEEIGGWLSRRRTRPAPEVKWHMIGHLQRNKVRNVVNVASAIHSVDSLRLGEEINNRAERIGRTIEVLLQVNCSEEEQKHGVAVGAAMHLGETLASMKNLRLTGLMTMAPLVDDPERTRPVFQRLREIFEEMRTEKIGGDDFRHLSMGMSQDYIVAVEEGATLLRIGRALFEA